MSTQFPATQPVRLSHGWLHPPQWPLSLWVSTQEPAQMERPGRQLDEHWPPEQAWSLLQVRLHPPQCCGSTLVGMQWPSQSDW